MPDLGKLLNPASLVVIGASEDTSTIRGHSCETLLHHRWDGRVYFVSRSSDSVFGHTTYKQVADLPEVPDMALLLTPAAGTVDALRACGAMGIGAAVVVGSGFADGGSPDGSRLQDELTTVARDHDIALSGPNAEGFADTLTGLAPTFSPVLRALDSLPEAEPRRGGRLAVVAQSGALGFALFDLAWSRGLNVRRIVTTGNSAVLTLADYLMFLADEGETDTVLVFAEGFQDGRRFFEAAERCRAAGLPIVMVRVGRSAAGQRQAASHTGALASDDALVADLLAEAGVIEADDPDEAVEIAALVAALKTTKPASNRVGVCSSTGGGAGLLADLCERDGLVLPGLSPETRAALDAVLPDYGSSENPVDSTATGVYRLGYSGLAKTIASDPGVDAVIVAITGRVAARIEAEIDSLRDLVATATKPVVFWAYTTPVPRFRAVIDSVGIHLSQSPGAVTKALAGLARLSGLERRTRPAHTPVTGMPTGAVTEAQAYPVLEGLGLSAGAWTLAVTPDDAKAAAADIGGRLAFKIQSTAILHKTEAGGVRLNVTPGDAVEAFEAVMANARAHNPEAPIDGVLVQSMAPSGVEMILGALDDPNFGPVVLVGAGGIHAEVLRDTAFAAAPVGEATARAMIDRLVMRPLLDGVRRAPPADIDALVRAIVAVSHIAATPGVRELDLNPVFVHGAGLTVADALFIVDDDA